MDIKTSLINEIKHEGANTRKMLSRVPDSQLSWKPHDKSRALMNIAKHVANIYTWVPRVLKTDGMDLAKDTPAQAPDFSVNSELLAILDKCIQDAVSHLEAASHEDMARPWTFSHGDHVIFTLPKAAVIRDMALNHTVHHRGQLSVYLRLLNVPVPGMYGPSADENM